VLLELRIRDFAIIDTLGLRFGPGLTVLTGETGAGKSIIVDAVELVLGEWADSGVVRTGTERALVEAVFRLDGDERGRIGPLLEREGLEGDDAGLLLLGREVRLNKRNICRVNGRSVTLALLREVTDGLVDIHGQSEHLSLLRVNQHLRLLDRYAGLGSLRDDVSQIVERVQAIREELDELRRDEREVAHRIDLLSFQIDEIGSAGLEIGEEDHLLDERPRLANAERLAELTEETMTAIEEGEPQSPAAMDLLGVALRPLAEAARLDGSLKPLLDEAESLGFQLEELARQLRDYQAGIEYNPRRLREVEERLSLIRRLQRKYGETIEDVLAYAEEAEQELEAIKHSDERIEELEGQEKALLEALARRAQELSRHRREAATELSRRVEEELADLKMEGSRFGVRFDWRRDAAGVPLPEGASHLAFEVSAAGVETGEAVPDGEIPRVAFKSSGIDRVEFLVSANPGEPLKPMARIASGGETSRLMLALKAVLSRVDDVGTLIFDEIDQGIGGRVGATVGEKLWGLASPQDGESSERQVLCVTHLPQLAGFGDRHLCVEKGIDRADGRERTVTRVRVLDDDDRVVELAKMLGGPEDAARQSAEAILRQVAEQKQGHEAEDASRESRGASNRSTVKVA
jgi:DNA repair protein RecN (Recombination protein N)